MSDFRSQEAGTSNARAFTLVKRADGAPITSGTVNWYLKCISGANTGKWWRDSDQTWQASETANAMTHQADGHWTRTLAASPWTDGDLSLEYAKESGDLHVPVSRMLKVEYTPTADSSRRVDLSKVAGTSQTAGDLAALLATIAAYIDTEVAAIKAKTDQLTFTTANRVDASTTGGGSGASAAEVWSYAQRTLTQTAAQLEAVTRGQTIVIHRGDSLTFYLTGLGVLTSRTRLYFTLKDDLGDADTAALLQVREGVGMVRLNGNPGTAAEASLTVTDATAGDVTLRIEGSATAQLAIARNLSYDIQMTTATDTTTLTEGKGRIEGDVTRTVS